MSGKRETVARWLDDEDKPRIGDAKIAPDVRPTRYAAASIWVRPCDAVSDVLSAKRMQVPFWEQVFGRTRIRPLWLEKAQSSVPLSGAPISQQRELHKHAYMLKKV